MSRTYRKSSIIHRYPNIESYERSVVKPFGIHLTRDAFSVEEANWYFDFFRDGTWGRPSRRKMSNRSKKLMRSKNREIMHKLKKNVDFHENTIYVDNHTFKYLIWCYD